MYQLIHVSRKICVPALLALLLFVMGCGLKVWPEPQAEENRLAWSDITFSSQGTCLEINGILTGAYKNLAKLELEIAYSDADCLTCPFLSEKTVVFAMDAPELSRQGNSVRIKYCQLPVSATYRWRIVAYNVHSLLQKVESKVFISEE